MPIDEDTFEKYQSARERALELGLSVPEVLDRAGILLTAKRRHGLEVGSMEDVFRRLDRQNAAKLMSYYYGRNEGTAAEMFEAILQWLQVVCVNKAEGTLGDL